MTLSASEPTPPILKGATDQAEALNTTMSSPSRRASLLNPWTTLGVALIVVAIGLLVNAQRAGSDIGVPGAPPAALVLDGAPVVYDDDEIEAMAAPALAAIDYDWPTHLAGWRIEFTRGEGRVAGYTWSREQRIQIFIRPSTTTANLPRVIAHELGHAVDVTLNDAEDRRRWIELRGFTAPWWPDSGAADFATGAGDFAESFAIWQAPTSDFRSEIGDPPDAEAFELMAELSTD